MRLEFEPNTTTLPFVENDAVSESATSETEKMLREGVKAAQEGKRAEARNLLLRVTEMDAGNETAWLWLASISEYPEELLVFLSNVLKVNPENERALEWQKGTRSLLAKTLVQRGIDATKDDRNDFARQCFEQALGHEENNEMAWLWLASVAESEEEKTACFEKVLSFNPENETAQSSLKSIHSQKMQKLLQEAITEAVTGSQETASGLLETVLEQDGALEEAWVLKSHLAASFDERAECFVQILALNPDHEMAKASVASWRMLAEKAASQPKPEELSTATQVYDDEEFSAPGESSEEDFAPRFSNETEQFPETEATDDFSAPGETEPEGAEFYEQHTVQFSLTETFAEEFSPAQEEFTSADSPTQELTETPAFQAEEATALMTEETASAAPQAEAPSEPAEELPTFSSYQEFQAAEVQFEADEMPETVEEDPAQQPDLAAELQAEEAEMNWAFSDRKENFETENFEPETSPADFPEAIDETEDYSQAFSGNPYSHVFSTEPESNGHHHFEEENFAEINHAEPAEEMNFETESSATEEAAPDPMTEYSYQVFENSPEPEAKSFAETDSQAEFGEVEMAEENSFEMTEDNTPEVLEMETEAAFAPEKLAENNYLHQFAEMPEESFANDNFLEVEEAPAEAPVSMAEPQFSAPTEEKPRLEENSHPSRQEMLLCPFCNTENEKQAFACAKCQTILTLSDLEMLLNQQDANREMLEQSVESLEREHHAYGLNAEQLAFLGIGHVNLKNYRQGFAYLQEAVRMNPSNVLLDAQVNSLAIRLSEIEEQQSVHDLMPKNRKILVVDDSPTVRKLISGKLEKCGHEVVCAVDGLDALEKINELMPDLILLDITMPRMDGYQVCKMIRNNDVTKDVPVVMISGKDGFFDKVRGRMAGTTGYITKPFGPETLMKTVETYLN